MSDQEIDERLRDIAQVAFQTDCLLRALIQLLIDRKVLKGKEEDVFTLLEEWAAGLAKEETAAAKAKERARLLFEKWKDLPPQ